jgi:hypothetical protein
LFIRGKEAFAIFVIFVRCALKGQGEMAAAPLRLIRKLVYGEIIRKIRFPGIQFHGGCPAAQPQQRHPLEALIAERIPEGQPERACYSRLLHSLVLIVAPALLFPNFASIV